MKQHAIACVNGQYGITYWNGVFKFWYDGHLMMDTNYIVDIVNYFYDVLGDTEKKIRQFEMLYNIFLDLAELMYAVEEFSPYPWEE